MYKFRFLIGIIIFIAMVYAINHGSAKEFKKWDALLNNNVVIKGKVLNIKQSGNHAFGIILVKVDSSNVKEFSGLTNDVEAIYPYKIKDGKAELYVGIPLDLAIGDKIVMNSNKREGGGYDKDTVSYDKSFSVYMVRDGTNLNYVKKNTDLK